MFPSLPSTSPSVTALMASPALRGSLPDCPPALAPPLHSLRRHTPQLLVGSQGSPGRGQRPFSSGLITPPQMLDHFTVLKRSWASGTPLLFCLVLPRASNFSRVSTHPWILFQPSSCSLDNVIHLLGCPLLTSPEHPPNISEWLSLHLKLCTQKSQPWFSSRVPRMNMASASTIKPAFLSPALAPLSSGPATLAPKSLLSHRHSWENFNGL